MRRFVALMLMFIVPLQFAWATAAGLHGHLGEGVPAIGLHVHDHDYHDLGHADHDAKTSDATDAGHNDDGHHVSHCHHVFSPILMGQAVTVAVVLPDRPPLPLSVRFFSHTPSLLDPPPPSLA